VKPSPNNAIRAIRRMRKVTQGELADAIGIDRPTLSRVETGSGIRLANDRLLKAARFLKCLITDLYNEEDLAYPGEELADERNKMD